VPNSRGFLAPRAAGNDSAIVLEAMQSVDGRAEVALDQLIGDALLDLAELSDEVIVLHGDPFSKDMDSRRALSRITMKRRRS
jgi:hypothetical protein